MDIQTLQAVLNEMEANRTRFKTHGFIVGDDYSIGTLFTMNKVIGMLRTMIEDEASMRDQEAHGLGP